MQIRERATTWALIRTEYDKAKKRGVARCMGTVPKAATQVPPAVAAQLSARELEQIDQLLRKEQWARDRSRRDIAARYLPQTIARATDWYLDPTAAGSVSDLVGLARDTREEFSRLLSAMVKAGVGRTRKRASSATGNATDIVAKRKRPRP